MKYAAHWLTEASVGHVFGANVCIVGAVSVVEFESILKVSVLLATLVLTCLSGWLKWRNRDKAQD